MMQTITKDDFYDLCEKAGFVQAKPPKVFALGDEIIKIFYPKKKRFSSDKRRPYALRFVQNAEALKQLGIDAPKIKRIEYCPDLKLHLLSYPKLPGEDVRFLVSQGNERLLRDVIAFTASLHQKGIFFGAIHIANIIYHEGQFSLLDIGDMVIKRKPLNIHLRYRNLRHMLFYREDREVFARMGFDKCIEFYINAARLSLFERWYLKCLLSRSGR